MNIPMKMVHNMIHRKYRKDHIDFLNNFQKTSKWDRKISTGPRIERFQEDNFYIYWPRKIHKFCSFYHMTCIFYPLSRGIDHPLNSSSRKYLFPSIRMFQVHIPKHIQFFVGSKALHMINKRQACQGICMFYIGLNKYHIDYLNCCHNNLLDTHLHILYLEIKIFSQCMKGKFCHPNIWRMENYRVCKFCRVYLRTDRSANILCHNFL